MYSCPNVDSGIRRRNSKRFIAFFIEYSDLDLLDLGYLQWTLAFLWGALFLKFWQYMAWSILEVNGIETFRNTKPRHWRGFLFYSYGCCKSVLESLSLCMA